MNRIWQWALTIAYRLALCYWFVFRPHTRGVYVAIWVNDSVLIVKNSYKRRFSIPAGGLKRGERFEIAAIREVREEVGIELQEHDLHLVREFQSTEEFKHDSAYLYECLFTEMPNVTIDNREVVKGVFVHVDSLVKYEFTDVVSKYFQLRAHQMRTTNAARPLIESALA